jgi:hypothetical protein
MSLTSTISIHGEKNHHDYNKKRLFGQWAISWVAKELMWFAAMSMPVCFIEICQEITFFFFDMGFCPISHCQLLSSHDLSASDFWVTGTTQLTGTGISFQEKNYQNIVGSRLGCSSVIECMSKHVWGLGFNP